MVPFFIRVQGACQSLLLGFEDATPQRQTNPRLWYGLEAIATSAANLSKTLWGVGNRADGTPRADARRPLRERLGVDDDSPLRDRRVRNSFEHLDEHLEAVWDEPKPGSVLYDAIMPRSMLSDVPENRIYRWLERETGDLIFQGYTLNIHACVAEAARIAPIAEAEFMRIASGH